MYNNEISYQITHYVSTLTNCLNQFACSRSSDFRQLSLSLLIDVLFSLNYILIGVIFGLSHCFHVGVSDCICGFLYCFVISAPYSGFIFSTGSRLVSLFRNSRNRSISRPRIIIFPAVETLSFFIKQFRSLLTFLAPVGLRVRPGHILQYSGNVFNIYVLNDSILAIYRTRKRSVSRDCRIDVIFLSKMNENSRILSPDGYLHL